MSSELIRPVSEPDVTSERGDGYLRQRLGRVFELDSRRLTALRDWIAATIAVASQQFAAFGVDLTQAWFFVMIVLAGTAIFVSSTIYPRLPAQRFLKVEQGMMLLAWGTIAALVYASGGSDSPYIFFYAQTMFYSAYFFSNSALAVGHIAFGSLCALAPIAYDFEAAMDNDFVPTIAIALGVWWAMAAVVALKHRVTLRAEHDARGLSLRDPLTGTANLRALEDFVASIDGLPYAAAMVDLNGLGAVNSRFGYFAGDDLLRRAASALREASRPADQVARVGGDEFLVLMPGQDREGAERWKARFIERMAIDNNSAQSGVRLAAEIGVGATDSDVTALSEVIAQADRELYAGKGPESHAAQPLIAPHERAERLAARVDSADEERDRLKLNRLKAPAGYPVALFAAVATYLWINKTGSSTTVFASPVIVIAAYFAYFGNLRQAVVGVGATLTAFGVAFFDAGSVTSVAQTRFSTVVFATLVVAYALQSNGRKLMIAEQRSEQLSLTDALTGLPNRRAFDREFGPTVDQASARGADSSESFAGQPGLILIDLENFRDVNTALGHRGGDELLCEATDALRDAAGTDGKVFRVGGDQFAVIVFAHHIQRVEKIALRCEAAVREIDSDGHYIAQMVAVGADVGFAYWRPGVAAADLIEDAVARMKGGVGRPDSAAEPRILT